MTGTWYITATGEIMSVTTTNDPAIFELYQSAEYWPERKLLIGEYGKEEYYVDGETPTLRTENQSTISGLTISGLYNPSTVDCGELGTYEVTDGEFEFTIDTPGTYKIVVKSVPYFDKTFEVVIDES